MGLTHLSFADDLLIFCKGSFDSILEIKCILKKFYEWSGLRLNAEKNKLFASGVRREVLEEITRISGFHSGTLPVRYLGVPLITRKITEKDCLPLIEKIRVKLRHWYNLKLSYAGRLQLIRDVLFNIANFWCRQLILPQSVLMRIEQLCVRYFWKGSDSSVVGAKVSWSLVCSPKAEGGLGLRDLKTWNKACLFTLMKNILAGQGSLWVAWIQTYVLKGASLWHIAIKPHFIWCMRKILEARDEAFPLFGSIRDWALINTTYIWTELRTKNAAVPWQRLIWFPLHVPKHAIIAWLAILNRLPTKSRLVKWGIMKESSCVFCGGIESKEHLFFSCPFSRDVWSGILRLCNLTRCAMDWIKSFSGLLSYLKGKTLIVGILNLAWSSIFTLCGLKEIVEFFSTDARLQRLFLTLSRGD